MRSATPFGERAASSSAAFASGLPETATRLYIAHSSSSNRSQPPPVDRNMPVHSFLKTPFGKSASGRSHQVMSGAMASTRSSYPAVSRETAPP